MVKHHSIMRQPVSWQLKKKTVNLVLKISTKKKTVNFVVEMFIVVIYPIFMNSPNI